MKRKKQVYSFLVGLVMVVLIGCGKQTSEASGDSDGCIVVQIPEGSTIESLFDFKSTEQISLSGATSGIIHVGILEDGNSVVWNSDSVFLYVQGEAQDVSVMHYSYRLEDKPISYSEFKKMNL
ncbi:hypothetical protein [Fusicatenibacter sp.]